MTNKTDLLALEAELDKALQDKAQNRLRDYSPYPKQMEFHAMGMMKRERLLMAGNQQGKTYCGANECACHLTGRYPDWWTGRRWDRPVSAWAGGVTSIATRDIVQAHLMLGTSGVWPSDLGQGAIPKDCIVSYSMARGVTDAVDTLVVKHKTGGNSILKFKSYEQGRAKWQGGTIDFIWFDEEPPEDIYTEGLSRTNATKGLVYTTFTPLLGMSTVVKRFVQEESPDRGKVTMTIRDAEHIEPAERDRIIASYPAYQRDARVNGVPMLGSGRIFTVPEERIICAPFEIPRHWAVINGLDIGIGHPTAITYCAWDRDADVFYVMGEYRVEDAAIPMHAAALKARGADIPVAWPHDAHERDKGSGLAVAAQYRQAGCRMLTEHAQFSKNEGGGNSVEAGLLQMQERMATGRWKIFSTCHLWLEEYRQYHRDEGQIIKIDDDLISSSRYAYMMRRFAKSLMEVGRIHPLRQPQRVASGLDYDVLGV